MASFVTAATLAALLSACKALPAAPTVEVRPPNSYPAPWALPHPTPQRAERGVRGRAGGGHGAAQDAGGLGRAGPRPARPHPRAHLRRQADPHRAARGHAAGGLGPGQRQLRAVAEQRGRPRARRPGTDLARGRPLLPRRPRRRGPRRHPERRLRHRQRHRRAGGAHARRNLPGLAARAERARGAPHGPLPPAGARRRRRRLRQPDRPAAHHRRPAGCGARRRRPVARQHAGLAPRAVRRRERQGRRVAQDQAGCHGVPWPAVQRLRPDLLLPEVLALRGRFEDWHGGGRAAGPRRRGVDAGH